MFLAIGNVVITEPCRVGWFPQAIKPAIYTGMAGSTKTSVAFRSAILTFLITLISPQLSWSADLERHRQVLTEFVQELLERMQTSSYAGPDFLYAIPYEPWLPSYDEGCDRMYIWNLAARELFAEDRPRSHCYIEIGPNGIDHINRQFEQLSVKHKYQPHVLYVYIKGVGGTVMADLRAQ